MPPYWPNSELGSCPPGFGGRWNIYDTIASSWVFGCVAVDDKDADVADDSIELFACVVDDDWLTLFEFDNEDDWLTDDTPFVGVFDVGSTSLDVAAAVDAVAVPLWPFNILLQWKIYIANNNYDECQFIIKMIIIIFLAFLKKIDQIFLKYE